MYETMLKTALLLALVFWAGCEKRATRRPRTGPWKPTMTVPSVGRLPVCEPRSLAEMEDDDIIMAVNGVALTKGDFGLAMRRYWWSLGQDKMMKPEERARKYRLYGKQYLDQFLSSQLLACAARRQRLISEPDLVKRVEAGVKRSARKFGMPTKVLGRSIPGGLDEIRRTLEEMCWTTDYVSSNVMPRVEKVDDVMVSNVIAQVEAENRAAETTNKVRRATITALRRRIVEGGEDFGKLADEYGMDDSQKKGEGGYWKSFRTSVERDPVFVDKIYPMPVGGVSEVLEDDEGYYLVKVLKIEQLPMPTNAPAEYRPPKDYDLARIFVDKEETTDIGTPNEIRKSFQAQFYQAALRKELEKLAETADIVYPYGTNLFSRAQDAANKEPGKKKLSKKERRALREAKIVKKALDAGEDPKAALKKAKRKSLKAKKARGGGKPGAKKDGEGRAAQDTAGAKSGGKDLKNSKEAK